MCIRDSFITVDLRSGTSKPSAVPPPRPYRRREMVLHSPVKPQGTPAAAGAGGPVPPSVAAATPDSETDLLGGLDTRDVSSRPHEFDAWNGVHPPGTKSSIEADVHAAGGEDGEVKVNSDRDNSRYNSAEADRISVAGGGSTTPPSGTHPELNPCLLYTSDAADE